MDIWERMSPMPRHAKTGRITAIQMATKIATTLKRCVSGGRLVKDSGSSSMHSLVPGFFWQKMSGRSLPRITPATPASKTITGKDTPKNCPNTNEPPANAYSAGCLSDFFDSRMSASITMATTAAAIPWKIPATMGTCPLAAASHERKSISITEGNRKHSPAMVPPQ